MTSQIDITLPMSSWCGGCGRRRMADGRCPNCDAWWSSPYIRFGAPLLLATCALLYFGLAALRTHEKDLVAGSRNQSRPIAFATIPSGDPFGVRREPERAVSATLPPATLAALEKEARAERREREREAKRAARAAQDEIDPAEAEWKMRRQIALRTQVAYVDALIAADDAARAQSQRSSEIILKPASVSTAAVIDAPMSPASAGSSPQSY